MKQKKMKLSFKKQPRETGLRAVGQIPSSKVKINGKVCGWISGPSYKNTSLSNKSTIGISFFKKDINEDGNPNCRWKNVFFKHPDNFNSHEELKAYATEMIIPAIEKMESLGYKLRFDDED